MGWQLILVIHNEQIKTNKLYNEKTTKNELTRKYLGFNSNLLDSNKRAGEVIVALDGCDSYCVRHDDL